MSSIATSLIVFACVFGGALIGILFRSYLPEHHLSGDSKETVKIGMGLVATMSALVLGLLVSSAKAFYDTQSAELTQLSADVVLLDRMLAHYGPETKEARYELRVAVVESLDRIWPRERGRTLGVATSREDVLDKIQALSPKDDRQHSLQAQAIGLAVGIARTRWLMYQQLNLSVSKVLLAVMVFWLAVVFFSFGPLCTAQRNRRGQSICCRIVGFRRDSVNPGYVHALHRTDSDLKCPNPFCSCTTRSLAPPHILSSV